MAAAASPFRADCLAGRVALVTGGGSGIGFEVARQLGLHGCRVAIMGRREAFLAKARDALAAEGVDAMFVSGDVRSVESCAAAVEAVRAAWQRLDVLVNGAAGNWLSPAEALSSKGFRTVLEIDTMGTFNMSREAFPLLKESPCARIVNISATLHYGTTWYQAHACAAKAAIDSLTRSLALEWGAYGIRCMAIAPGPIADTPGMAKLAPTAGSSPATGLPSEVVPVGRLGRTWDVAMAAVFIASDGGDFCSGDVFVVDGGHWLWKPPLVPRETVTELSRRVEGKSRSLGPGGRSRL
mmetsp:Transcript_2189/g.7664  ORF Transcript_2189/g.7664 Transcript_2189/m.7664 type:complete len:296 (-) Transcript_2189:78-965(-)